MELIIMIAIVEEVEVEEAEDINLKLKIMVNNLDINKVAMKAMITLNIVNIMHNMVTVNQDKKVKVNYSFFFLHIYNNIINYYI